LQWTSILGRIRRRGEVLRTSHLSLYLKYAIRTLGAMSILILSSSYENQNFEGMVHDTFTGVTSRSSLSPFSTALTTGDFSFMTLMHLVFRWTAVIMETGY
jgi:hypothetical protein